MKPDTLLCRSAAKINLTLDILGRRADGYHELRSIVHTVAVCDELRFEFGGEDGFGCNLPSLACGDNLCVRAADLYYEAAGLGRTRHPLFIGLTKNIPFGAGLGGGSGNAAATLAALNRHFATFGDAELSALAARLGADIPLFLQGGCLLMEGIGERIEPLPPIDAWLVLVKPAEHGDTRRVFAEWDAVELRGDTAPGNTDALLATLKVPPTEQGTGTPARVRAIAGAIGNGLRAAAERCGMEARSIENRLLAAGALGACMSGSGSACYGLFADEKTAAEGLLKLRAEGPDSEWHWCGQFCDSALRFD